MYKGPRFKRVLRGTKLVRASSLAEKTKERGHKQLTVAGVPVPTEYETLHFQLVGLQVLVNRQSLKRRYIQV